MKIFMKGIKKITLVIFSIVLILELINNGYAIPNPEEDLFDLMEQIPLTKLPDHGKDRELIFFWATWCVTCKPKLQEILPQINQRKDVAVITVNIDEDLRRAQNYVRKNKIELPILRGKNGEYVKRMRVVNAPHWSIYKRATNNDVWILSADEDGFDLEKINKLLLK
ncbi:MAG: TlpA family protein disulfide reductase [Oligoflexia bacterium]|nr:TlpA family protein disulfide reductase [Oligoflexia bacterium]